MRETWKPWYDAGVWFLYTLAGLFVTVGISAIATVATDEFELQDITGGGQFAVYTAGMVVGTYYLLIKPAPFRLPFTEWFGIATLVSIICSAILVVIATYAGNGHRINKDILEWPSVALFLFSAIVAFLTVGLENKRLQSDPRQTLQRQQDDLLEDFRRTDGGN